MDTWGAATCTKWAEGTELSEDLLRYDVDVSWWVTPSAYDSGYYSKAYRSLCHWLATAYPFWNVDFSNREIPFG